MSPDLGSGTWTAAAGLALIVAVGCGRASSSQNAREVPNMAAPGDPCLEGVAGTMGIESAVMIVIRPADGEPVRVDGALAADIGRLTGATVVLLGAVQATTPWRTIVPTAYDVLAIDGQKPHVGVVRVVREDVWLETSPRVRLEGAPDALRTQHGAKVYVLGTLRDGVLLVQSFGLIRPPESTDR